jgi:Acetyltransferase (GNAT) domain
MNYQTVSRIRRDVVARPIDLIYRPITRNDIPALLSLYHLCFPDRPTEEQMHWRYFQSRIGASPMMAAFDGNTCVASFMVWPQSVTLNGKEIKTAQGCDAMVHPAYRGRSLFAKAGKKLAELITNRGYQLFFVSPSIESLQIGVRQLKWRHVCDVPRWARPLWIFGPSRLSGVAAATSLLRSSGSRRGLRFESQAPAPELLAELTSRRTEHLNICRIKRDREWFAWRYHADSDKDYRWVAAYAGEDLKAVAVWRFEPRLQRAHLCELIGEPWSIPAVLNVVLRAAYHTRARALDFPTNDPGLIPHLRSNGFIRRPGLHFVVRVFDDAIPTEIVQSPGAWRLYGGDFDYY